MIRQDQKTIAILDDDPVVGRALRALLQSVGGHEVWPLEEPRGAYCPQELFDGVDLLLLLAVSGEERHKGLITAMRTTPQTSRIPVLVLSTGRNTPPVEGVDIVEWPCSTDELARRVEATLCTLENGTKPPAPGGEIFIPCMRRPCLSSRGNASTSSKAADGRALSLRLYPHSWWAGFRPGAR